MSEHTDLAALHAESREASTSNLTSEIESLPPEMRTMVSVMTGFFRGNSGPDAETAKIMADAEMHEETCKLEAYTHAMRNRDQQNERDHRFRMKRLGYDNVRSILIGLACLAGIVCGLYLTVKLGNSSVGNPILVASFLALLGIKPSFASKEKE